MTKLNEFIGSIVSSITDARMMSDIQTVKVAQEYANHHLLKHFSVPRMRIENVELTIPIALGGVEEKTKTSYEPIDHKKFNSIVYIEVLNNLGLSQLPNKVLRNIQGEISKQTQLLEKNIKVTYNLTPLLLFSHNVISYSIKLAEDNSLLAENNPLLDRNSRERDIDTIASNLETRLSQEIKTSMQNQVIEGLDVIVEAQKLRENKPENIIYIKLKISEDGLEWDRTENSAGEVEERLLPE